MNMIYENDIPDLADSMDYAKVHGKRLLKMIHNVRNDHRWKESGITDNIAEWKRKNDFRNDLYKITATKIDTSVIKWDEERKMFYV